MARKKRTEIRKINPDPLYHNIMVSRLINKVMISGKKDTAAKLVYKALEIIAKKTKNEPADVLNQAIDNIKPRVEVRPRRVGGAAYQVPALVRGRRQASLALKWLISAARKKPNKDFHTFYEKLAVEIMDAYNKAGGAFEKRQEVEKIAEANRAFSHLRW